MAPTREKFLALTFLTVLFFALSVLKARAADPSAPTPNAGTTQLSTDK